MTEQQPPAPIGVDKILQQIWLERKRQVVVEGFTRIHDDSHTGGELAKAAGCYAICAGIGSASAAGIEQHYEFAAEYREAACPGPGVLWPWDPKWWKPKSPRADLVKAAALIVAEIERLDRAEGWHTGD